MSGKECADGKGNCMARKYLGAQQRAMEPAALTALPAGLRLPGLGSPLQPNPGRVMDQLSLKDFFSPDAVTLSLRGGSKDEVLAELVGLLRMDERSAGTLLRIIQRRENLGSTGIGRGIAIPHCRSLVVNRLRLAFGHRIQGIEFQAIDSKPVSNFFLIVAPPL